MNNKEFYEREYLINPNLQRPLPLRENVKVAILASGIGSNFEALILSVIKKELNITIAVLIVNKSNCKAIEKAQRYSIPYEIIDHTLFSSREDFDSQIVNKLQEYRIEALIMAGWMRIATDVLIDAFPKRILNVHPSLLPSFKGNNAIQKAIQANVLVTGCSVHIVSKEVDSGEILIQSAVPILCTDNIDNLRKTIQIQEHKILPIGLSIAANKYWISDSQG